MPTVVGVADRRDRVTRLQLRGERSATWRIESERTLCHLAKWPRPINGASRGSDRSTGRHHSHGTVSAAHDPLSHLADRERNTNRLASWRMFVGYTDNGFAQTETGPFPNRRSVSSGALPADTSPLGHRWPVRSRSHRPPQPVVRHAQRVRENAGRPVEPRSQDPI